MLAHDCHSLEKDCYVNSIAKQRASVTLFTGNVIDTYNVTGYNQIMIKSFRHKGLKDFYITGSLKGIQPAHAPKLRRILSRLNFSTAPQDMNLPGYRLHQLSGQEEGMWSVTVNGNWCVTFYFEGTDAILVDYWDYH